MSKTWKIIVTISIILSLTCIALIIVSNFVNGNIVASDTLISTVVALIGICTAFIVSFQIINYFEFRRRIETFEESKQKYEKDLKETKDIVSLARSDLSNAFVLISEMRINPTVTLLAKLNAALVDDYNEASPRLLLTRLKSLRREIKKVEEISPQTLRRLLEVNDLNVHQEWNEYDEIQKVVEDINELIREY